MKADIQNAVNAGKTVTVSKTDINFHGWIGCGYIIVDPQSGAGAYIIGGGLSGGKIIYVQEGNWAVWLLDNLRDPTKIAMLGYGSGLVSIFAPAISYAITAFIVPFTITDMIFNQNCNWNQVSAYVVLFAAETFAGYISTKNAAAFVATLMMNFMIEILNAFLQPFLARR